MPCTSDVSTRCPRPGRLAGDQRGEDAAHRQVRGAGARGGRAGEDRTVAKAEHAAAERADLRLHDAFVRLQPRVRPGRTEARDRAVHETGVGRAERLVVETPLVGPAGRETDEEHVGLLGHGARGSAPVFGAQVAHARCPCRGSRRGSPTAIRCGARRLRAARASRRARRCRRASSPPATPRCSPNRARRRSGPHRSAPTCGPPLCAVQRRRC